MEVINIENIKIPSVNNKYYKNFALKPEYRAFKDIIYASCIQVTLSPPYRVLILFSAYIDIDNPIKPILDALESRGVINNDRDIIELHVHKIPLKRGKSGQIIVDVETIE